MNTLRNLLTLMLVVGMLAGCSSKDEEEFADQVRAAAEAPAAQPPPASGAPSPVALPPFGGGAAPTEVPAEVKRVESITVSVRGTFNTADYPFGNLVLQSATTGLDDLVVKNESVRIVVFAFAENVSTLVGKPLDEKETLGGTVANLPVRTRDYVAYAPPKNVGSLVVFIEYASMESAERAYVYDWAGKAWSETLLWESDSGVTLAPPRAVQSDLLSFSVVR